MTEDETYAPLLFLEDDERPGTYWLLFTDDKMVPLDDVFDEYGYVGCGYAWEGVARSAVVTRAPELADRLDYDSEAGTFVAYGEDAEALKKLGMLIRDAYRDRALLKELIEAGEPGWFV